MSATAREQEKAIGARLAELRKSSDLSQSEFASQIGLTRSQLSNIEMGRSPLRYEQAARALGAADSSYDTSPFLYPHNPLWLARKVDWPRDLNWPLLLPDHSDIGVPASQKFSSFVRDNETLMASMASDPPSEVVLPDTWLKPYLQHWDRLNRRSDEVFEGCETVQEVFFRSAKRLASHSMNAYRLLKDFAKTPKGGAYAEVFGSRSELTKIQNSTSISSMELDMKSLIEAVRCYTVGRGQKRALAQHLKVSQSRVSNWLSGSCEPDGRKTLLLLRWLREQQATFGNPEPGKDSNERSTKPSTAKKPHSNR